MERLTIRNSDGSVSQPMNLDWAAALRKLADYEDSGLTPQEVINMSKTVKEFMELEKTRNKRGLSPKIHIKRCRLCGYLFVTCSNKSEFCRSPNAKFGGKPCNEVGPVKDFRERENALPLGRKYRAAYSVYHKWMQRELKNNLPKLKEKILLLLSAGNMSPEKMQECADKEIQAIKEEIVAKFNKWNDSAKKASKECVSEETVKFYEALVEIPPVRDRSPKLNEWLTKFRNRKKENKEENL